MLQSEHFYCLIVFVVVLHISQSQAAFCVCSSLQGEQEKEQEKEGKKKEEEEEGRRAFAHGTIGLEEETPVTYQITEVYTYSHPINLMRTLSKYLMISKGKCLYI